MRPTRYVSPIKEAAEEKADNVRHRISQSVEDAKEKAKAKIDEFKQSPTMCRT
jgi:vacuolar-type H+-ATPase subunit E/Vma4